MPRSRTPSEVLHALSDGVRDDIRKWLPGIVTAVNGQTVSVQLAVKNPLWRWGNDLAEESADAPVEYEDAPVFTDVPWVPLRAGGFVVWLPVAVGDCVAVFFSDLSTDTWRGSDGSQPVEPGFIGKHTHDSPYAAPLSTFPDSKGLQTAAQPNALVIGQDGSDSQIVIKAGEIRIGASASDFVALASKVATELNKIAGCFASFNPGSGGAGWTPANIYGGTSIPVGSVAATLAKAE